MERRRSERITYDDVANICELFSSADIDPTVLKIHSILERGSNSTIVKHLNRWKEEESSRKTKLSIKTIRFLEAEIENEAIKMTSKAKSENVQLTKEIKLIKDDLDIANGRVESLYVQLDNQEKENKDKVSKLTSQIKAEKIEKNSYKVKFENLEVENKDTLSRITTIEMKHKLSLENEKKLEAKIDNLEKEKEKLLLKQGELKLMIELQKKDTKH